MAQNKPSETAKPDNENTKATTAQNTDGSADDTELASAVAAQVEQTTGRPVDPTPAPTPGDTVNLEAKTGERPKAGEQKVGEKTKPAAQKAKSDDGDTETPRKRANGSAANGKGQDDIDPARRDRQIAQGRQPDDDPGYGRHVRRGEDNDRPSARRDDEQRSLFGEPDDTYYDRRSPAEARDRGDDYDRGRRASQGYGHTAARDDDERLSREYGSDYRRYSDAGYDDRNPYRGRDRAVDQGPYGERDRYYSEGGQYRERPQGYRPNDNGRDFEREAREQPRNRWRESNVDPRYDDAYDQHRNRAWSSQGNQDRHRDWDRDDQERYSNERRDERYRDEGRYRGQDRGYDQSSDRFDTRGYGNRNERSGPIAGNRSNAPAARADDRGNANRWRDERRDDREYQTDDRYESDRTPPWRRR
jgi:hypothetical protein